MSPQNNGEEPAGTSSAAAASPGTPKVRQAFALPAPAAAPTTELTPAGRRAATASPGDGAVGPAADGPGESTSAPAPTPAPTLAPAPAPTPTPDHDPDEEPVTSAGAPVPDAERESAEPGAGTAGAAAEPEPTGPASGTSARSGEPVAAASGSVPPHGGAAEEAEAVPGRPRKPILAAAAIAGAVLISVPFLISGSDKDRASTVVAVDSTNGTVLDDSAPRQPGQYASESASPSTSASPSAKRARPVKGERQEKKSQDAAAQGTAVKETPAPSKAPAKAPARKKTSTASSKPAADTVTVAGDALVSKASGKCLSAGRGTDGTQLILWTCNGSAEQHWDFRSDGTIRSKGLCMDVAWASKDDGTAIQVARCSGNPAQQFYLNSTDDLVATLATKCVDVYSGGTANGTPAILWPCTGSGNQTWYRR